MPEEKKKSTLRSFPKTYWIVILFEFFERGSYYGMMSVLSVYLTDILGFTKTNVGLIKGTIQPILYFLPIISGAIADRFGYRRTLTFAFALLGGGYFLTSQMTAYTPVFLALCVMALGAGTFKPIISGTIARTTDKSNSTVGFGIFYWSINLGAFLFPLILVPFLKNSPMFGWRWVIIAAALGTGAMIIPTIFLYKEPPKPETKDKKQVLNFIRTVANAFEIIYSPFVLIYHSLVSSKKSALIIYVVIALLGILSIWQYTSIDPISEDIIEATYFENGTALIFSVDRNVMKQSPFSIKEKVVEPVNGYNFIFDYKLDNKATTYIKRIQKDGADINVTILKSNPLADSVYSNLKPQIENIANISISQIDSVLKRFNNNTINRINVKLSNPDKFSKFKVDLLTQLQTFPALTNLNIENVENLAKQALEKSKFTLNVSKQKDAINPYVIEKHKNDELALTIYHPDKYSEFKARLLAELRQNPSFISFTQSNLDGLVAKAQQRSFFLLYLLLLFVSSLIILKLQKDYIQSDKVKKAIYNLVSFAGIVVIIWFIPGLNLFSRIISTIIYFTVLSLFTIEIEDKVRFKDNFRFLMMIFIYSGFWILYFQMFDSVLWYVKAYVDASSLNNFVNSALGSMGVNINWFFDVEHVTVINAGTIILLQLVVSNIVKNTKALPTMIAGIAMGTVGMAILAISTDIWVFMVGIVIFSIGEMTAHPKFISYVGLTAPKDRVATYMGYIFLYGVIGSSIGAILGANMYVHFVDKLNQPRTLWLIFSGIGIATIIGLLIYNKFAPKVEETE